MNMKKNTVFFFLFCAIFVLKAQNIQHDDIKTVLNTLDQEAAFVTYNTNVLLVGESFFYKFHALNKTNKPSVISRIGYIELVNESLEVVARQQLQLINGMAYGDIFMPTAIPSGNYKLLAYTQWMKNWGVDSFFQSDITIINPFQSNQKAILNNSAAAIAPISHLRTETNNIGLSFQLEKDVFSKREKVRVDFNSNTDDVIHGNYTMLVRKKESLSNTFLALPTTKAKPTPKALPNATFYVPEMRGELVCGKIIAKKNLLLIDNKKVALSILNTDYQLKIASTDSNGNFCISISDNPLDKKGILQVLGDDEGNYDIVLNEKSGIDYGQLVFKKFELDASMKQSILNRSIHNQIENAFYSIKPDTIKMPTKRLPFYGKVGTTYLLDDYTRFPSFRETVIEIISNVRITNKGLNKNDILVTGIKENYNDGAYKPLIVVDGIVVQDVDDLIGYNANKIKSITVVREKYMVGAYVFAGIFDVITFEQDFAQTYANSKNKEIIFNTNVNHKVYFKQQYESAVAEKYSHIPDYRHQLYWNPEFTVSAPETTFDFYTSDVSGVFQVTLLGFSKSGKFIQVQRNFEVE
tara:strand:+ start:10813 stop:12552 length:1740 start_codon:yes stop_codon:yes gene_type:complete